MKISAIFLQKNVISFYIENQLSCDMPSLFLIKSPK